MAASAGDNRPRVSGYRISFICAAVASRLVKSIFSVLEFALSIATAVVFIILELAYILVALTVCVWCVCVCTPIQASTEYVLMCVVVL